MIKSTDLRNGTTFLYHSKPYKVIKYTHQKIGRGGATVKVSARNLLTNAIKDHTFSSEVVLDNALIQKRKLQYLYSDDNKAMFMDPQSYEQVEIAFSVLGNQSDFLSEGEKIDVLFWEEKPISIELKPKVTLKVAQTDPGIKGNSATNIYKPAILENGLKIKVPLFIKEGDEIRVDTRTGEYVERAK